MAVSAAVWNLISYILASALLKSSICPQKLLLHGHRTLNSPSCEVTGRLLLTVLCQVRVCLLFMSSPFMAYAERRSVEAEQSPQCWYLILLPCWRSALWSFPSFFNGTVSVFQILRGFQSVGNLVRYTPTPRCVRTVGIVAETVISQRYGSD